MTIADLMSKLSKFDPSTPVMIQDDIGPRTINSGPRISEITQQNSDEIGDCEELVGTKVVLIGCGNY